MSLRIALFSDTFPPDVNGVANFVSFSAQTLAERGHKVEVYTVSRTSQKRLNEKFHKKFRIFTSLSFRSPIYSDTRVPIPTGLIFPHIFKFKPNIIHAHTPFTLGWEAVMAAKILRIPLIGTHHTFYDHYLKHAKIDFDAARKATWKYTTGFYNFFDIVTTPSQSLAEEMTDHGLRKPTVVMPNFVDNTIFKPAGISKKRILKKQFGIEQQSIIYVGRLSYEKSIDQAIRAFNLILKKSPSIMFMIIGDGPERENLKSLASKLNIANKIIFTGFLRGKSLIKALQANDVFVTASKTETFCIAALEAMAVGLPVVAANEKGLRELVRNNKNGFLITSDSPAKMAGKILELFSQNKILEKFSQQAISTAAEHSSKKVIKKLEDLYIKLIKTKK